MNTINSSNKRSLSISNELKQWFLVIFIIAVAQRGPIMAKISTIIVPNVANVK